MLPDGPHFMLPQLEGEGSRNCFKPIHFDVCISCGLTQHFSFIHSRQSTWMTEQNCVFRCVRAPSLHVWVLFYQVDKKAASRIRSACFLFLFSNKYDLDKHHNPSWKGLFLYFLVFQLKKIIGKNKRRISKDNPEVKNKKITVCFINYLATNLRIFLFVFWHFWTLIEISWGRRQREHDAAGILLWKEWR